MIVVDANVLIALLNAGDVHNELSEELFQRHVTTRMATPVYTLAETLLYPMKRGTAAKDLASLMSVDLEILPLDESSALALTRLRIEHGLRLPDAVVLHAAIVNRASLATFDVALANAARAAGVPLAVE